MSRSTGAPVPEQHPDHDLLADLAAEVLPSDLAERVQDHVMNCPYCATLLAEAEGIRSLLLQSEPETMPAEVWTRLERAFVTARHDDATRAAGAAASSAGAADVTGSIGITGYMGATGTMGAVGSSGSTRGGRRAARSGPPPPTTSIGLAGAASGGPPTGRLSRMSRPTQRARRQAIEEQKADRPSLLSRFGPATRIAAGLLVVLGVGALTWQLTRSGSATGTGSEASAKSSASVPLLTTVVATSTNYSRSQLKGQIQTLITSSQKVSAGGAVSSDAPRAAMSQSNTSPLPAHGTAAPQASAAALAAQGQQLRSPAALQACLTAIGTDQQPITVDLARYAGQEAAIIVLPAEGGGYVVDVVARTCRPGDDGTIDVVTLKSP